MEVSWGEGCGSVTCRTRSVTGITCKTLSGVWGKTTSWYPVELMPGWVDSTDLDRWPSTVCILHLSNQRSWHEADAAVSSHMVMLGRATGCSPSVERMRSFEVVTSMISRQKRCLLPFLCRPAWSVVRRDADRALGLQVPLLLTSQLIAEEKSLGCGGRTTSHLKHSCVPPVVYIPPDVNHRSRQTNALIRWLGFVLYKKKSVKGENAARI